MVNFEFNPGEKLLVCKFSGRLDTLVCTSLSGEVQSKITDCKQDQTLDKQTGLKISFDMKEVTFISSAFIRICLFTYKEVGKGSFSILNSDPFLKKTFKIAGLSELLSVS